MNGLLVFLLLTTLIISLAFMVGEMVSPTPSENYPMAIHPTNASFGLWNSAAQQNAQNMLANQTMAQDMLYTCNSPVTSVTLANAGPVTGTTFANGGAGYTTAPTITHTGDGGGFNTPLPLQEFHLVTIPGQDWYEFDHPGMTISNMVLNRDGYDILLMAHAQPIGVTGNPSWPSMYHFDGHRIQLWPTPDHEYRLRWNAFDQTEYQRQYDDFRRQQMEQFLRAQDRSIALLKEWLNPAQLADFERHQSFRVRGGTTGTVYEIAKGTAYNVKVLDDKGKPKEKICFVPGGTVTAIGDIMLAQKVMLENNEPEALRIANHSNGFTSVEFALQERTLGAELAAVTRRAFRNLWL